MEKCCSSCIYCQCIDGEWVCMNVESEGYGFETSFDDYCGEWEKRSNDVFLL